MRATDLTLPRTARELAADIYRTTRDPGFASDGTLRLELRDRATTILTSLSAGYEYHDAGALLEALTGSAATAAALESLLDLAVDAELIAPAVSAGLRERVADLKRQIAQARRAVLRYRALGAAGPGDRPG